MKIYKVIKKDINRLSSVGYYKKKKKAKQRLKALNSVNKDCLVSYSISKIKVM